MENRKRQRADELLWQGHPSPKGLLLAYTKNALLIFVSLLVGIVIAKLASVALGLIILGAVAFIALWSAVGYLLIKTTVYEITRQKVSEKRGIINIKKEQARIPQITNITVERNLSERILGIGRINIDTAPDRTLGKDILRWWGIEDPNKIESLIDGARYEDEDVIMEEMIDDPEVLPEESGERLTFRKDEN